MRYRGVPVPAVVEILPGPFWRSVVTYLHRLPFLLVFTPSFEWVCRYGKIPYQLVRRLEWELPSYLSIVATADSDHAVHPFLVLCILSDERLGAQR